MSNAFAPATDLLGQSAPLAERLDLPLLGVPVRYRSNSPAVIALAERALGRWRDLPAALRAPGPPLQVDIVTHAGPGEAAGEPQGFVFRAHGDTFLAAAGASVMTADMAGGKALAFVTPALAADEANLRHNVVECLGFLLVNYRDRTPVHAAGLVRNGRAILLVGPSGAGKSTLCYACVRAGFDLLSEDTVCVSLAGEPRVWGHAGPIHLLPDAPRLFPELASLEPRVRANGKLKLAVEPPAGGAALYADRAVVCFVERSGVQASRLESMAASAAAARLADPREPGFDLLRDRAPAVAAALTARGAYRLAVGAEPASAALLLAHLADL